MHSDLTTTAELVNIGTLSQSSNSYKVIIYLKNIKKIKLNFKILEYTRKIVL